MINVEKLLKYTSNLTLLYVEDDKSIRDLNCEIFIDFFDSVELASNGEEGIMKYFQHKNNSGEYFDIVITDVRMPRMNGIIMSRYIKEKCPQQVIIVLSAHRDSDYLFELINMGISYFLPKPASIETLYEMLFTTSKIIHDRKAANDYSKKLNSLNMELKSKVIELNTALEKVEEATQFKDRFLANMSHEIRTPMNAIIGLSHILLRSPLEKQQQENVKKIENSSKILLQIINNILDFSKIEAGKLELESIEFDLDSVITHLSTIIDVTAMSKDIEISYNVNKNVAQYFIGDPVRLGQILLNLMTNAVKFTHHGKVILNINTLNFKDNISILQFEVIDEGIGIAQEKLETLFDSFIQADNSITREYGGSGLGLTIVKKLISKMDGTIEVSSTEGKGTIFTFTIALRTLESLSVSTQHNNLISSISLQNRSILLVEDNEINRHVIINFLDNSRADILIATNGLEALNILKETDNIDLILMDISMPVMDGYEATVHIREDLKLTSIPIIGLSANAMQKDIDKALDIGMNGYISKPVDVQQFYNTLAHHLNDAVLCYSNPKISVDHPFHAIEGLDVTDGLERMEYNVALYEKVVVGFFTMFKDSVQKLTEAIKQENYDNAYKLCHDIKGSSGNISATTLYLITKEMEDAISSHQWAIALTHLKDYAQEFSKLSESINNTINTKGTL